MIRRGFCRGVFGNVRRSAGFAGLLFIFMLLTGGTGAARAGEVEVLGQIGGAALAVAVQGNYAYLVQGPNLEVLDLSSPERPVLAGEVALDQACERIAVVGSRVYVAGAGSFEIVDVSRPSEPRWLGAFHDIIHAEALAVSGSTAYLADGPDLLVLDVGMPSRIRLTGVFNNGFQYLRALQAGKGNLLYAATDAGLLTLDVTNKNRPYFRSLFEGAGGASAMWARDVAVRDGLAYLATDGGLLVIDVTRPTAPWLRGACPAVRCGEGVALEGGTVYVGDYFQNLVALDIANPARPEVKAELGFGLWRSFSIQGGHAYGADPLFGLRVLDLAATDGPHQVGEYRTDSSQEIKVQNGLVYVANGARGLELIDATVPDRPWRRGQWGREQAWTQGVLLADGRVYTTDAFAGLQIFAQAGLGGLRLRGSFKTPGEAARVAVEGPTAYVADGRHGLQILDVTSPEAIRIKGQFSTVGEARDIAAADRTAYVLSVMRDRRGNVTASHLESVDARQPAYPKLFGGFFASREVMGLDLVKTRAFLSGDWNIYQVEKNEEGIPVLSDHWDMDGIDFPQDAAFRRGEMFIADAVRGLVGLDMSKHGGDSLTAAWEVPGGYAKSVAVGEDGTVYLASEVSGIYILRVK